MKEKVQIEAERYFDPQGFPTCATDFSTGKICEFMRTQRFGANETCIFAPESHKGYTECMNRRKNGEGYLIPGKWCPLFKDK